MKRMAQIIPGLVACWFALILSLVPFQSRAMTAAQPQQNERARYLNPNTGRFWTVDSFAGNNIDPRTLHKYLYAANNPINMVDPSGNYSSSAQELGYDAEDAINNEYLATHVGQERSITFGTRQYFSISSYLKPDIFNSYPTEKHFLEIKPISTSGVFKGIAKIALDYENFKPDYSPDTQWQSRTYLLTTPSTGTTIFVRNIGGIIFYQDIDLLQKKLILTAVLTTPKGVLQLLRFPYLGELAPAFARLLGFAEGGGLATAVSADLGASVGIASSNATMGAE